MPTQFGVKLLTPEEYARGECFFSKYVIPALLGKPGAVERYHARMRETPAAPTPVAAKTRKRKKP